MRPQQLGAVCLVLGLVFAPRVAHAGNEVAAETLFDEAKKLAAQGRYAEACPIFAESNRLDRGAGTMIHLANCYEKNKQSASAWATYKEAASAAQALNKKDWEKLAKERAAALEPKLARLTIKVDPSNHAKIEVTRDGVAVAKAIWGVSIPVDVGAHPIEAKAPGHKPFHTSATIVKDGETVELTIPRLEAEPEPEPAPPSEPVPPPAVTPPLPPPAPPPEPRGSSRRTLGFIVGGVGVAGLAVGTVTGLMAIGKASDAKDVCPTDGGCSSRSAVDAADSARTLGAVSTAGFIVGGVGLAAGAVLVFTAPSKRTGLHVAPNAGPNSAGLTVLGAF
ncbi:MAG: hypothetical protein KIT84_24460 [Labilithrix sp.]|nr:hypothetical protein [Labilithrix sp.]MCW5814202.1 hypothetical protein [Labilithrix sp.]